MNIINRLVFCIMIALIIGAMIVGLYAFYTESFGSFWDYTSFEISDWLINYEGGFVRRGLVGQLMLLLYQFHPYPVRDAIVIIYILGFFLICLTLIYIFKKEGWSFFILPFSICLYYSFTCDLLWTRRDYWSLLITFIIYRSYCKYIFEGKLNNLLLFYFFSAFTLLMHEASFFYSFPILFIIGLFVNQNDCNMIRLKKMFITFIPVILIFVFVVTNKGDAKAMEIIWQSWEPCFSEYPMESGLKPELGDGVFFLDKSAIEAIMLHIRLVWFARFAPFIPSLPFNLYMLVVIYYLVSRLNTVDLGLYDLKPVDNVLLSNILIIQFISLLPMFGFLSCDLGRIVPYWVISSLFMYHVINRYKVPFVIIQKYSVVAQSWIDSIKVLNKPWLYIVLIVTLPLNCYYGATYEGVVPVQYILKVVRFWG